MVLKAGSEIVPNRIQIGRCVGTGSTSRVFVGKFDEFPVAIKIYTQQSNHSSNERAEADLMREANVLITASHPNVLRIYGVSRLPEGLGIVMELGVRSMADEIQRLRGLQSPKAGHSSSGSYSNKFPTPFNFFLQTWQ